MQLKTLRHTLLIVLHVNQRGLAGANHARQKRRLHGGGAAEREWRQPLVASAGKHDDPREIGKRTCNRANTERGKKVEMSTLALSRSQ